MIKIRISGTFYESTCVDQAWITSKKTGKSRLVELHHPGVQYKDVIEEVFEKRGFTFNFR